MDRLGDETEYVLIVLQQMREEATAHPESLDPHALKRIDEAIALIQGHREVKAA